MPGPTHPDDPDRTWHPPPDWSRTTSGTCKYQQVASQLSRMIDRRRPGEQLPPEQQLAALFRVSHMTIRRALELLSGGGRIRSVRGRGTFVAAPTVTKAMANQSFSETMRLQGRVPSARVLGAELAPAATEESSTLGVAEDAMVIRIRRLRLGDDIAMCLESTSVLAERFATLLGCDLTGSLYELLQSRFATTVHPSSYRVRAHSLTEDEAELLDQATGSAAIRSWVTGADDQGVVVESTMTTYRGDLYELLFTMTTQPEDR